MSFSPKHRMVVLVNLMLISMMALAGINHVQQPKPPDPVDLFAKMTAATPKDGPMSIIGLRITDLDGGLHRLGMENGLNPVALVLLDVSCPISNRYLPYLEDLHKDLERRGTALYGFLSDPTLSRKDALTWRKDFKIQFPLILDATGDLTRRLGPTVTPEAFLIGANDRIGYRGRIDDRFAAVGKRSRRVRNADFANAIDQALRGKKIEVAETRPVGCIFGDWTEELPENITYTRHIAPILNANCVECHQDGGVAPFALDTFEMAQRRADMSSYVVTEGIMPPWRADVSYSSFRDERTLSDRQIALLNAWAKKPVQGNPEELIPAAPKPNSGWRLGTPDRVLTMTESFTIPAEGEDIYRYFVLPFELLDRKDLVAIDFRPGDPSVVHHSNFFIDYEGRGRQLDAADPGPGFSVDGTGGFMDYDGAYAIGGWAPGAEPYKLPPGLGGELYPGGDVVIEVHYHLTGKETTDQSSLALYFNKGEPVRQVANLFMGTQDVNIPGGDDAYQRYIWMNVPADMHLIDITPHMHYLGTGVTARVILPDDSIMPLIRVNEWDLRWQNIFVYREPIYIPAGSRIEARFSFDNSDDNPNNPNYPAKDVPWGWGSDEEMCEIYLTILPSNPGDLSKLTRAARASWMRSAAPVD